MGTRNRRRHRCIVRADDTAITDGKIALKVNDAATGKVDLDAVITPENATNVNVVWYSSKEEVATVDESGVVTALSAGETVVAVVTVDGDKIATVTITVEAGEDTGYANIEFLDFSTYNGQTLSAETQIAAGNGGTITVLNSGGKVTVDGNSKSMDEYDFDYRLKLGGTAKANTSSVLFDLEAGAKITVYAMSSNSSVRTLALYGEDFSVLDDTQSASNSLVKFEYTVTSAGKYFVGSTNSGMNIYGIIVEFS